MKDIDLVIKLMHEGTDEQLRDFIPKGALLLSEEEINTVTFGFWTVFMAEKDLNSVIQMAWSSLLAETSEEELKECQSLLTNLIGQSSTECPNCGHIILGREVNVAEPEYFSDKIKIVQALYGKNRRTEVLWKLNDIRNDISHNRIDRLQYNKNNLSLRSTKEQLIKDYLESAFEFDMSKSKVWDALDEKIKEEIMKGIDPERLQ